MVDIYGCLPLAFARGEGSYLYDADGNRYLDFFCGLAVTSLGHKHPGVVRAICEQAEKLTHVSNVFHTEPGARLVERLAKRFGDGKVFLGNSGAEANEAAIKLARKWGHKDGKGRFEILATLGSFHGRTMATLSATGQEKYHQGFLPLLPGFKLVNFDDIAALEKAIGDQTVAIMVEPIQGEGGVVVPHHDYLKRLRELCDRAKLLLILDEVQTGTGRTGKFFCYEHANIKPDIVTLAKALGGGTADRRDDREAGDRERASLPEVMARPSAAIRSHAPRRSRSTMRSTKKRVMAERGRSRRVSAEAAEGDLCRSSTAS